jgi:ATP-binding cassette, subfamily B (MDR/TAP), member 1
VLLTVMLMGMLAVPIMAIQKAIPAAAQFFSTIDSDKISYDGIKYPDVSPRADIQLEDVHFAYPTRPDVQVLRGFTACFEQGRTTALVGPSGSGKSTIVALLERWYQLSSTMEQEEAIAAGLETPRDDKTPPHQHQGKITIGGRLINEISLKWWRSQIGLVQQEPFLFNDTIYNNVAFGLNGTEYEHADVAKKHELVRKACEEAYADEFIQRLPDVRTT